MENDQKALADQIKLAIESENIPKFYINGFVNAYHIADVILVCTRNGKVELAINMSYTTAKTLAEKLNALITTFEKRTNHDIMTIDTIKEKISKFEEEKKNGSDGQFKQ
jgi:nucleoside-triphosphatase THEP1